MSCLYISVSFCAAGVSVGANATGTTTATETETGTEVGIEAGTGTGRGGDRDVGPRVLEGVEAERHYLTTKSTNFK